MINLNDNYTDFSENDYLSISIISDIGDRKEQQDRIGYETNSQNCAVVVCDGMGGHEGGKLASSLATEAFINNYKEFNFESSVQEFLIDMVSQLDKNVANLKNSEGDFLRAGSTLAGVIIQENKLNWVSVGDSRIYAFRNGEIVQITKDHIYNMILEIKKKDLTDSEYSEELKKSGMLISFLGVDGLPYIESNDKPFELLKDDIVLITSDGLYKILTEKEICKVLRKNKNFSEIFDDFMLAIKTKNTVKKIDKDNISIAIIKVK